MDLRPGDSFERYSIESLIGRGGMGVVYLARDVRLGRKVALKVLAPEIAADEGFRERFAAESRLAASLDEPHIVPVYDADEYDGRLYIAMRYVPGFDLDTVLRRQGRLDPSRSVRIIQHVAAALDAAHDAGLTHRDVKPANILLSSAGQGADHAYLADFGLALASTVRRLTMSGQLVGSLEYIAPEQLDGRPVDRRADIYSLGGVLYACLTGNPPYRQASDAALLYAHLHGPLPVPSQSTPDVPAALDAVVAKAMAKGPADRFATAGEMASAAVASLAGVASLGAAAPAPASIAPAPAVAAPSASGPRETRTPSAVRKTVTILFTDLVGSTSIGEQLDPEALGNLMESYFGAVRDVIERHGGVVEKFIGDAAVGVFGVPTVHEDDALRAVRAAAEIVSRLDRLSASVGVRLGVELVPRSGINTGEVMAGMAVPGQPIAMGDPMNIAARLQQAAEPGQILLGESTMRLVRDAVMTDQQPPVDAKGKSKPVLAYLFRGLRSRSAGAIQRVDAPLVGRADEVALVLDRWARTRHDRNPRMVTILAGPGIGKSRLVLEATARAEGARILQGRCLPYGEGITYWPIREVAQEAAGVTDADTNDIARTRLLDLLGADPQAGLLAERLATAVGLVEDTAPQQEIFWAVRRLVEELGRQTPTIIVLEDLGWAEPTLLDLVEYVVDLAADSAVMILATARPDVLENRPGWSSDRPNTDLVRLAPLSGDAALDLVRAQTGGSALPEALASRISAVAEGNPLFIEEIVGMLRDDGALGNAGTGGWEFTGDARNVAIPPTIRAILGARIDRLSPTERRVAECASVIGRSFEVAALDDLVPMELRPGLGAQLRTLVRREMLQPDRADLSMGDAFRFRHILIRDAAYESLPKSERADLHRRFAAWLAQAAGNRLSEFTEICGYHLEQAYGYLSTLAVDDDRDEIGARAAAYLSAAGSRADGRGEPAVAESLYKRAIAMHTTASSERAEMLFLLARVQRARGRFNTARDTLALSVADAAIANAARATARAEVESVLIDIQVGANAALEQGKQKLAEAAARLRSLGDDLGLADCLIAEGGIHELEGRNTAAATSFTAALEHALRAGDTRAEIESQARLILNLILGEAHVDVGIERCEEVLAAWAGQPLARASTLDSYALLLAMAGRPAEALAAERAALSISAELDDKLNEGLYRAWGMALVLALANDVDGAATEARAGCALLLDLGERSWLSSLAPILGELELALGDKDAGRKWLDLAEDVAGETDIDARTRILVLRGRLAARGGDLQSGLQSVQLAVNNLEGSELLYLRGIAAAAQAELLALAGRDADSKRRFAEAIALHERKGDVARATRVMRMRDDSAHSGLVPLV